MIKRPKDKLEIPLPVAGPDARLLIYPGSREGSLLHDTEAFRWNESPWQVFEGNSYYCELENAGDWELDTENKTTGGTCRHIHSGRFYFQPNTFVGTYRIPLIEKGTRKKQEVAVEVRSSKISYEKTTYEQIQQERSEYQDMLNSIASHAIGLILEHNVPVSQSFESGLELAGEDEVYQRFLFVRSLFRNAGLEEALQKIISNPATRWISTQEKKDISSVRRLSAASIREITSASGRIRLPQPIAGLESLPQKITSLRKTESYDTPENRFIRHILESFLSFCRHTEERFTGESWKQEREECQEITVQLENHLQHSFFQDIGRAAMLQINSPVLQRRSGYREFLQAWLRFHLQAQLSWNFSDEDNIFSGGKKNIASLYEYWVFFELLQTVSKKFSPAGSSPADLIQSLLKTDDSGLRLLLQQGKKKAFSFLHQGPFRNLNVRFYFNRPFAREREYQKTGSYSHHFRPDFTLSVWPENMDEKEAEEKEAIVHIHFDAKYRIEPFFSKEDADYSGMSEEDKEEAVSQKISKEEKEEEAGNYKNTDLFKMHAYRDAIRRSGGSYILYPGEKGRSDSFNAFHEIIPGVGAFALRPDNAGEAATVIADFISKVIANLEDVLSQREQMARHSGKVYRHAPEKVIGNLLRQLHADDGAENDRVLVGFCKGDEHQKWIRTKGKYNIRYGEKYPVDTSILTARYLLFYRDETFEHASVWVIKKDSGRLKSKEEMLADGYPNPSENMYLVFVLEEELLLGRAYHFPKSRVENFQPLLDGLREKFLPFTLSLAEFAKLREAV
jgi:predicted component of viral defense system (DUF524 family)